MDPIIALEKERDAIRRGLILWLLSGLVPVALSGVANLYSLIVFGTEQVIANRIILVAIAYLMGTFMFAAALYLRRGDLKVKIQELRQE